MPGQIYRNTLVLHGAYLRAFISKAIDNGFAKPIFFDDDEPLSDDFIAWEYSQFYKHNPHKTTVLQMMLLFDNIILLGVEPNYDFSPLVSTGFFEALTVDDVPGLLGNIQWNRANMEYAMLLKPIVLDYVLRNLPNDEKHDLRLHNFVPYKFYSILYDIWFASDKKDIPEKELINIALYVKHKDQNLYLKYKNSWDGLHFDQKQAIKTYGLMRSFRTQVAVGTLLKLLEFSIEKNALLMQSDYGMKYLKPENNILETHQRDNLIDVYQILRFSVENSIGHLPHLSSISDVLRLKEKKRKDIYRLRLVLDELEVSLRQGKLATIKKAEQEVRKASSELSKTEKIDVINKWLTYISLPLSIVETYMSLPPVYGLTIGVVGAASTLVAEKSKEKNGWILVIR